MADRRMVYPYTLMAKLRNTPFKWLYNNNIFFKSCVWAAVMMFPLMWKMQKISFSEPNLKALEAYRKREALENEEHKLHLL